LKVRKFWNWKILPLFDFGGKRYRCTIWNVSMEAVGESLLLCTYVCPTQWESHENHYNITETKALQNHNCAYFISIWASTFDNWCFQSVDQHELDLYLNVHVHTRARAHTHTHTHTQKIPHTPA
jgi:hypothetical protein